MKVDGYMSAAQAAEVLGVHERTVRRWCVAGKLGKKVMVQPYPGGKRYLIHRRAVSQAAKKIAGAS